MGPELGGLRAALPEQLMLTRAKKGPVHEGKCQPVDILAPLISAHAIPLKVNLTLCLLETPKRILWQTVLHYAAFYRGLHC